MAKSRITIRIGRESVLRLQEAARTTGRNESELVRNAIEDHLTKTSRDASCLELARACGLIGATRGLPPDLSSSKKHLEGLGR